MFKDVPLALMLCATLALPWRALAHEVPREIVVDMQLRASSNELRVTLRVPPELAADIGLTDLDRTASSDALRRQAAQDIANRIDVRDGDAILRAGSVVARLLDDRTLDVTLGYAGPSAAAARYSARLNGFQHPQFPVRTNARFENAAGQVHRVSVSGAPQRVTFDPDASETAERFAVDGLARIAAGSLLWFLLVLAAAPRRGRTVAVACASLVAGQTIAGVASAIGLTPAGTSFQVILDTCAAAMLVAIGVQTVTNRRSRWVWPSALAFGLIHGFRIGIDLREALPFAGFHVNVAIAAFFLAFAVAIVWIVVLLRTAAQLIVRLSRLEHLAAIVVAVPAIHAAMHAFVDGVTALGTLDWPPLDRHLVTLTAGWTLVFAVAAGITAWLADRFDPREGAWSGSAGSPSAS